MCVILICPNNIRPDRKTLAACAAANPHGAGIAWREGHEVRWTKTNELAEIRRLAEAKLGEIVIHFRIASVGGVSNELRHPFPVSRRAGLSDKGTAKAVLFQNGTWTGWRAALDFAQREGHAIPEGRMSDSRAAAFLVSLYGPDFLDKLTPSRWVFYSATSTAIFGDWETEGGILYSNLFWQSYLRSPKRESEYPKDGSRIPSVPERHDPTEMELWDMTATRNYWDTLYKACPKPKKY